MIVALVILLIIFGVLIPGLILLFGIFNIVAEIMGAPYVPTSVSDIYQILEKAKISNGQIFMDLGCGDGRVVRIASLKYRVIGYGFDVNPLLILYAKILSKFQRLKNISFGIKKLSDVNIKNADTIFLFLTPGILKQIKDKLLIESKPGSLLISHGFRIKGFERFLMMQLSGKSFPTYFYKIKETN